MANKPTTTSKAKFFIPILSLILFLSATGCSSKGSSDGTVEISVNYNFKNVKPFEKSPYDVSYEIIPLQLPQYESIRIYLNNIEVFEDYIYVSTLRESIFIFDKQGNFVNKIAKGEDISEINSLTDFMIDRQGRKLEVFDKNRIVVYDLGGNYMESKELDGIMGVEYGISGENRIFLRHKNSLSEHTFTITPGNKTLELKTGQTVSNILNPKHFSTYQNTLYFTGYSNKVYSLESNDSIPNIIATVNNMNQNPTATGLDIERYQNLCAQKKHFTYINNFFVYNPNLWGFTLFVGETGYKIFMDTQSGKYYSHPLTGVPYSQNNRWVENQSEYYLFPVAKFSEETATTIKDTSPDLYNQMERAPADTKMWIIKTTYTNKQQ